MIHIYALQRTNGDWFAFGDHGHLRVPVFHSSHDAMLARVRNLRMLPFKPVELDPRGLRKLEEMLGESGLEFLLVDDPFANSISGSLLELTQLVSLMGSPDEHQRVLSNGKTFQASGSVTLSQSEWWN